MKLIDLLVQELPKCGGWPSSPYNGEVLNIPGVSWSYKEGCYPTAHMDGEVVIKSAYENAIAASQNPEWSGDGLPPAGCVCEVKGCMSHYLKWNKVTVFAVRGRTVFFDMEDGRWGQTESHEFRPMRTEDDRKRDWIIDSLKAELPDITYTDCVDIFNLIAAGKIPHIILK
ncbi:hypothetical protein [Pantoea anthophila]|uniref:hypothetical protein n=1 Tax=Pantoea anthophila TaxID=470931 RepID=UPI003CF10363